MTDTGHLKKPVRLVLDDLKGIFSELADDAAGEFWTDAFDQAAAQIFFYTKSCCGKRLLEGLDVELSAIFGVDAPAAAKDQDTAHMNLGHIADRGDEISEALLPETLMTE